MCKYFAQYCLKGNKINFFEKTLAFLKDMRYNNTRRLERYSNGKEPHWKCGVPQGIVRSSRILSASVSPNTICIRTLCI